MSDQTRPRQVVVAYDFSPTSDEALGLGVEIACREPIHVLQIITAIDSRHGLPVAPVHKADYPYAEKIQKMLTDRVTEIFAGRRAAGEVHFFVHSRLGHPAEEVLGLAHEVGADLILIGSHGRTGVDRLVLGSVSEKVSREAKCPVMVVRPKTYREVEMMKIVDDEHVRHTFAKPHRYSYHDNRVQMRPPDWPLN
jgi:nucleotide-binding universal stress UspA family protein